MSLVEQLPLPLFLLALGVAMPSGHAFAQDKAPAQEAPAPSEEEARKIEARARFGEGFEQVKKFQWADALSAFEKSHALVPYANTSLNIGVCERALGRYVRARRSLRRALAEHAESGGTVLSASSLADANSYLAEIDSVIVRAKITIRPTDAAITVDGRPIEAIAEGDKQVFAAGIAPTGPGKTVPSTTFELVLDPGNHVFVLSRTGFSDAVVNRTLTGGAESPDLVFELEKLPARIKVSSTVEGAIVKLGAMDVGPVPVDVFRPAGVYPVKVQREGFVPYETSVSVKAGEEAKLNAVLSKESLNVAEQWWFWSSIVGALGTAAVITYFAVRPEPEPPPYDGGTTGWVVPSSAIRF